MAGNYLRVRIAEVFERLARNISMGCAVEAVTADLVLIGKLVGDRVGICFGGHSLMERRIHNNNLRDIRHNFKAAANTHKMRAGMERCDIAALFEIGKHVIHTDALNKPGTAVDYTVTDSRDLGHIGNAAVLFIRERLDDHPDSLGMVGDFGFGNDLFTADNGVGMPAADPDIFAITLCDDRFVIHIEKLIFKRRASRVYYKYEHNVSLLTFVILYIILPSYMKCKGFFDG